VADKKQESSATGPGALDRVKSLKSLVFHPANQLFYDDNRNYLGRLACKQLGRVVIGVSFLFRKELQLIRSHARVQTPPENLSS